MRHILRKLPYFNKRIAHGMSEGQSLVEFALISILLFTLLFGIMEMGRLMFIFSQVSSAAQEGTRYGLAHPRQVISTIDDGLGTYRSGSWNTYYPANVSWGAHSNNPCNIVAQARAKVVLLNPTDVQVVVGYDNGSGAAVPTIWSNPALQGPVGSRVIVTTTYQFHFLVGIFDPLFPDGIGVRMVSARTIQSWDDPTGSTPSCTYDPGSAPTYTPIPSTPTPTGTPTQTPTITQTPTRTPTVPPGSTSTATPTRTNTPVPTNSPTITSTTLPGTPSNTPAPTGTPTKTATLGPTSTITQTPIPTLTPTATQTPVCNQITFSSTRSIYEAQGGSGKHFTLDLRVHLSPNGYGLSCVCTVTATFNNGGPAGIALQSQGGGDYWLPTYCSSSYNSFTTAPTSVNVTVSGTISCGTGGGTASVNLSPPAFGIASGTIGTCP